MTLPACCLDMDISVMDLIFPERLQPEGREFFNAHGLDSLTVTERDLLIARGTDMGAGVVKIRHRCAQLTDAGRCAIYADRPAICRNFDCAARHDCACRGQGLVAVGDVLGDA